MKYEMVSNKQYISPTTTWSGICPRFSKKAEIFIQLQGSTKSKDDLQVGFSPYFKGCNQLKEHFCIDCPLMEEYKKSHDY